jgi:hypothetical protein
MGFDFAVAPEGLMISGCCAGDGSGTLLGSTAGQLLVADPRRTYPLAALVRALSRPSDWLIPATAESRSLLSLIAVPTHRPPAEPIARQPWSRVRLHEPVRR